MGTYLGLWECEGQLIAPMEGQREGMQKTGHSGQELDGPVLFQPIPVCGRGGRDRSTLDSAGPLMSSKDTWTPL